MAPGHDSVENIVRALERIRDGGSSLSELSSIKSQIEDLRDLAAKLRDLAERMDSNHDWRGVIQELPALAHQLSGAADAYQKVFDDGTRRAGRGLDRAKEVVDQIDTAYKSLELLASLSDRSSLDAFLKNPSDSALAEAWAADVTRSFTLSKELVDSLPLHVPVVEDMLRGYLSAPEAYVEEYLRIQKQYVERIDARAHLSNSDHEVSHGGETWMTGPLSAYVSVLLARGKHDLATLLKAHKDDLGEGSKAEILKELSRLLARETSLSLLEAGRLVDEAARSMGLEDAGLAGLRQSVGDFDFDEIVDAAGDEIPDDPLTFGVDEEAGIADMSPAPDEILDGFSADGIDGDGDGVPDMSPAPDEVLDDFSAHGADEDGDGVPDMSPAADEILDDLSAEGAEADHALDDADGQGGFSMDADEPPVDAVSGADASSAEPLEADEAVEPPAGAP